MVWQVEALQLSPSTVAKNLGVDTSTVKRTLTTFNRTGRVDKADYPSTRAFRILTEPVQLYLVHLILDRPGIYLREMKDDLEAELGVEVTESAICKFLKKAGFTHQRLSTYAAQRDDELRREYSLEMSIYPSQTLVFVDETGSDRRDTLRKKGYNFI